MSNLDKIILNGTEYTIAGSGGLSEEAKTALLNCFENAAWTNIDGQAYYDALYSALYSSASLTSISATYTQSGTVYDTDTLDSLKPDLVVMAHYDDSTTQTLTTYTLSGTLETGTSTITVSYGEFTTTFTVTVTHTSTWVNGQPYDITWLTGSINDNTGEYNTTGSSLVSEMLPCNGVSAFVFGSGIYQQSTSIYYYDSNRSFIGKYGRATNPVPSIQNAAYIRVYASNQSTATVTPYKYDELQENTAWASDTFYELPWTDNYGLNGSTGAEYSSENYNLYGYSFCYGASTIDISDSSRKDYAFYDSAKNRISGETSSSNSYTVPSGAYYFRLTVNKGYAKLNRVWAKLS